MNPGSVGPQRIALTGATGFLGSHIADGLLARGCEVRAAVRPTSNLHWISGKGIETLAVDLTDPGACRALLKGCAGLIHCAGTVTAPDEEGYQRANVLTTKTLLQAAEETWSGAETGKAFVLISSLAAHGPAPLGSPAREDDPSRPITAYGRSKRAAEELVLSGGWRYRRAILRPPSLYGPRDREFLPLFKAALQGFTARLGDRLTGLSLVHGRDAAGAAIALLQEPSAEGLFFVDDGHGGYSLDEMREALESMAGRRIRTLNVPLAFLKFLAGLPGGVALGPLLNPDRIRDLDTPGWVCDGTKLERATGWKAGVPLAAGFAETVAFMKEQNWL